MLLKRRISPTKKPPTDPLDQDTTKSPRRRRRKRQGWPVAVIILSTSLALALLIVKQSSGTEKRVLESKDSASSPRFLTEFHNAPTCSALDEDDVSFTLVTQLSDSRLWMLEHHCKRWGPENPMSIAILTDESNVEIEKKVRELGCTKAQVQTLSGSMDDYPVNELRNMALSVVKTTHVVYLDVDFWPSSDLHASLHQPRTKHHLASDHKHALVVPAFQLERQCREYADCREDNIPAMPNSRKKLLYLINHRRANRFDPTNEGGHGSTDYDAWFDADEDEIIPVDCILSNRYEPYLVFRFCEDLPPFQPTFTGYGKNKMTWMMQLRRKGYKLAQISSFAIHYPHLDSPARLAWNGGKGGIQLKKPSEGFLRFRRGQTDNLFIKFREWLNTQPDNAVIEYCKDALDDDSRLWKPRNESDSADNEKPRSGDSEDSDESQE